MRDRIVVTLAAGALVALAVWGYGQTAAARREDCLASGRAWTRLGVALRWRPVGGDSVAVWVPVDGCVSIPAVPHA